MAMTAGSTLWSGLDGPFPGRTDEGARTRQTPREGQGLGAGGRGCQGAGEGAAVLAPVCCTRERRAAQGLVLPGSQSLHVCGVPRASQGPSPGCVLLGPWYPSP